jgi:two-component system, NarL family, invasion response regulator UvrY
MIKVIIADDHSIVRRGIAEIISEMQNVKIVGEVADGAELLSLISEKEPDLVIMDISMPGRSGIEILSELKSQRENLKILILSMHSEEKYGLRVLKSGADGYLSKEVAAEQLPKAIMKIMGGGKFASQQLTNQILESLGKKDAAQNLYSALSNREYEVFILLSSGKNVSAIAKKLSLSVPTISTYRARVLEKLKMKTNADLTYYAIKNGLID